MRDRTGKHVYVKGVDSVYMRNYARKRRLKVFGLTPEQHKDMEARFNGTCYLCRKSPTPNKFGTLKVLAIDHDHETGRIRGLLCHRCNTGLGHLGDDAKGIQKALDYVSPRSFDAGVSQGLL